MKKIARKDFIKALAVVGGAGFGLSSLANCGSGSDAMGGSGGAKGTGGSGSGGSNSTGGSASGGAGTGGAGTGGSGSGGSTNTGGSGSGGSGTGGSGTGGRDSATGGSGSGGTTNTGGTGTGTGGRGKGGGGGSGAGGSAGGTSAKPMTTISSDPKHMMTVSQADVTAGVDKTYNIMGTSTHDHTVVVTAAMFTMLGKGMTVMATSSNELPAGTAHHTHMITVKCA